MKYETLKSKGTMIAENDRYRDGGIYVGGYELWAIGEDLYLHETNTNQLSYTGKSASTDYIGSSKASHEELRDLFDKYGIEMIHYL